MAVKYVLTLFSILFIVITFSCSDKTFETVYPTLNDGKYDSEFPYRNCSEQLNTISKSIKKISSNVFYDIYEFDVSQKVKREYINDEFMRNNAITKDLASESIIGTATIIYKDSKRIALITCAHIVNYSDTIVSQYQIKDDSEEYIKTIAIKKQVQHFILDLALGKKFEILAIDNKNDIAILGLETNQHILNRVLVFPYPPGNSNELEWGSFVYIMGYPMGLQMITRGIVSSPSRSKKGSFLIDAVFNHGFSGGLVLAIKDGVPNFEMVGMVKSASASYDNYLMPEQPTGKLIYSQNLNYTGSMHVKAKETIII